MPAAHPVSTRRRDSEAGMNPSELLRDLVCEFVHGAPYLDLLLQHRRDARETQAKSSGATGPNVRPLSALNPDVVPGDELHRAYQSTGKAG